MKYLRPILLIAAALALVLIIPVTASAQIPCSQCDPQTSSCSQVCYVCEVFSYDLDCSEADRSYLTCSGGGCVQDNCTPNFQETSRVVQGTYGTTHSIWPNVYCDHYRVEWVTQVDSNHCNTNSAYNTHQYCHTENDGWKVATHSVDCCDGQDLDGFPDSLFTCNNYHECTG